MRGGLVFSSPVGSGDSITESAQGITIFIGYYLVLFSRQIKTTSSFVGTFSNGGGEALYSKQLWVEGAVQVRGQTSGVTSQSAPAMCRKSKWEWCRKPRGLVGDNVTLSSSSFQSLAQRRRKEAMQMRYVSKQVVGPDKQQNKQRCAACDRIRCAWPF